MTIENFFKYGLLNTQETDLIISKKEQRLRLKHINLRQELTDYAHIGYLGLIGGSTLPDLIQNNIDLFDLVNISLCGTALGYYLFIGRDLTTQRIKNLEQEIKKS